MNSGRLLTIVHVPWYCACAIVQCKYIALLGIDVAAKQLLQPSRIECSSLDHTDELFVLRVTYQEGLGTRLIYLQEFCPALHEVTGKDVAIFCNHMRNIMLGNPSERLH